MAHEAAKGCAIALLILVILVLIGAAVALFVTMSDYPECNGIC